MRIAKFAGHSNVDWILKKAIPELEIVGLPDWLLNDRGLWTKKWAKIPHRKLELYPGDLRAIGLRYNMEHQLGWWQPDVFIVDDLRSHHLSRALEPGRCVLYLHGIYTNEFDLWYFKTYFAGMDVMVASEYKRDWLMGVITPGNICLHLPGVPPVEESDRTDNGRLIVLRSDVAERHAMYGCNESKAVWDSLVENYGELLDVYGYGNEELGPMAKGYCEDLTVLKDYVVGVFCGLNRQVSYGALELMSAGIPAVFYKAKEGLDEHLDGMNYHLAKDTTDLLERIALLLTNREERMLVGARGRQYIEAKFSDEAAATMIRNFMAGGGWAGLNVKEDVALAPTNY